MATQATQMQSQDESRERILRLHIAEYQALMAKSAALVNLTFTTLAVAVAFLGYMINAWPGRDQRAQILWSALLVEQVIVLFWLGLLQKEYGIMLYIEVELRILCEALTSAGGQFWLYESFASKRRYAFEKMSVLPFVVSALATLLVPGFRWCFVVQPWSKWEFLALAASLVLLFWTGRNSRRLHQSKVLTTHKVQERVPSA